MAHRIRVEAVGLVLAVAGAAWVLVSASGSGGRPAPVVALFLGVGVAFAASTLLAPIWAWIVPLAVVGLIGIGLVTHLDDLFVRGPLTGPMGYTNASAALYLQGFVASGMLFTCAGTTFGRVCALALAGVLGLATVLTGSQAATALLILPLIALLARRYPATVTWFGVVLVVVVILTAILGAGYSAARSGRIDHVVDAALSERRPALWHDALVLMAEHPASGVGPGRFPLESAVARSDRDARWAHNGFLQQGAEGGVPALALTLALFGYGFVRLRRASGPEGTCVVAAAGLASLGLQACIDYIFHFPMIPIVTAALVGSAVASSRSAHDMRTGRPDGYVARA